MIENSVTSEDVIFTCNGKEVFCTELALAHLFINDVIFVNSYWWRKDIPESMKGNIVIYVICNDVFAWAFADAEDLPKNEVENLYKMFLKDPNWGPAVWCMQRRNQMPQKPLEDIIRAEGIWDLDSMGLQPNTTS